MKKAYYSLIIFIFFVCNLHAQDIKFDDNKVLVDKTERFDFVRKSMGTEFSLYKLNTKDEIIYMTSERNGTDRYFDDDFRRITFVEQKITIESSRLKFDSWKAIIKLLLEDKVIDFEGNIDAERLERFSAKYNDVKR
ncbi:hypothetical protein HYN48_13115 [Flavobacterium magnum]|uniref:Uncharacterized protein n=1 Tax=Flavobacterium magnum TaxID=2162713 RepID=A0A2S0RHD8_9FLAO|nr:hypothetical protein [Flavobacterium magnum]AWA30939.1 hypothetical protein HYN48_13115 [Flavobacterium magnum]